MRKNQLIEIDYPGVNNFTTFKYDGRGHNVSIVETTSGSITSTKIVCWVSSDRAEIRNASGTITAQFFGMGETIGGTSYFYTKDHLSSIREMTNSSGTVQAEYSYDGFGRALLLQGSLSSDRQYAGYYAHSPSGLNLTVTRPYSSTQGRFITRDSIEEEGGVNLYTYVANEPLLFVDPMGLQMGLARGNWTGMGYSAGTFDTGGENGDYMPMLPNDPGYKPPKGCVDKCALIHDICMHVGHSIENPHERKCWNRGCHHDLSRCLSHCKGPFAAFAAAVFAALSQIGGAGEYNPNITFAQNGDAGGAPSPGGADPLR